MSFEDISNIFYSAVGTKAEHISRFACSSRTVYRVLSEGKYYAVKEYGGNAPDIPYAKHRVLCERLSMAAIAIPRFFPDGDSCFRVRGEKKYTVYPWLDGITAEEHHASVRQLDGLALAHSKLTAALRGLEGYEMAAGFSWSAADLEMRRAEVRSLLSCVSDEYAAELLRAKERQLDELSDGELIRADDMTLTLCHGDYYISQVLFDGDGRVTAVLDLDSIEIKPVAWELIRCFFSAVTTNVGAHDCYPLLRRYLERFIKFFPLTVTDILKMTPLFRQTLITTLYGYRELAAGDTSFLETLRERDALIRRANTFGRYAAERLTKDFGGTLV